MMVAAPDANGDDGGGGGRRVDDRRRDSSSSLFSPYSERHSLSALGLSQAELEELDRLMMGGDVGGGGTEGVPETEEDRRSSPDPAAGSSSSTAPPSPESIAADLRSASSEVDELNRIMSLHRLPPSHSPAVPRRPRPFPYAPELDGGAEEEHWRRSFERRERASTPGAVRVALGDGGEEEKEEVSMDGPRAGGRWKSGGGGVGGFGRNGFGSSDVAGGGEGGDGGAESSAERRRRRDDVDSTTTTSAPAAAATATNAAPGETASNGDEPREEASVAPSESAPDRRASSGGEGTSSSSARIDLEAGVAVDDDNERPRDDDDGAASPSDEGGPSPSDIEAGVDVDDDERPRDDVDARRGGDDTSDSNSDSSWDPNLPVAATVVRGGGRPRSEDDDADEDAFLDDRLSTVQVVIPAVKAEPVRWNTHLQDRRIRWMAVFACVLVAGLVLTLCLTLSLRGGGGRGEEATAARESETDRGRDDDDGVPPAAAFGNGTCGGRGYRPLCGECWCANDGRSDSDPEAYSCPAYPDGWLNSCNDRTYQLGRIYESFRPISRPDYLANLTRWDDKDDGAVPSPRLVTSEGSPCDPFLYHSDDPPSPSNPWEGLPKCYGSNVDPTFSLRTSVCTFTFPEGPVDDLEGCRNRPYEIKTYRSFATAAEAGATVTHFGACGVCSTAQDLSAILLRSDSFYHRISLCDAHPDNKNVEDGTTVDYRKVQSCYMESLGMTSDCALSYAIYSLGKQTFCHTECAEARSYAPNGSKFWLGGDPPRCEKTDCYRCTERHQAFGLSAIVGKVDLTSGITTDGRYSCNAFAAFPHIDHDPCDGAL